MAICDSKVYFSRDVKVYVKVGTETWEIPVLDGFSFSQASNSSEVVLSEMENALGVSRRGKKMFNDSLAPVEWSFSTYVRPFLSAGSGAGAADSTGNIHAVEEVLWALFAGPATRTDSDDDWNGTDFEGSPVDYSVYSVTPATGTEFNFDASNSSTLGEATIYFVLKSSELTYEITLAVVNEATINFDIDGIAMIEWSGMGSTIAEYIGADITPDIYEGITDTNNFIRNRLTSMTVAPVKTAMQLSWDSVTGGVPGATVTVDNGGSGYTDVVDATFTATGPSGNDDCTITYTVSGGTVTTASSASGTGYTDGSNVNIQGEPQAQGGTYTSGQEDTLQDSYDLTLTGGSITLSNNITYITPEELGIVNIPFAHVTGTRSISGSFTNYLVTDNSGTDKSADFWQDLLGLTTVVTHDFAVTFNVGGSTLYPRLALTMPHTHIEIPTHSIDDVISIETNFTALGTCINAVDELSITYHAN